MNTLPEFEPGLETNERLHVLLVDDNEADNFLHKKVVKRSGLVSRVVSVLSGKDALTFLKFNHRNDERQPDLILLDINMPGMNGWEFMEEYDLLPPEEKAKVVVMMLTVSLNPDDRERSEEKELSGFYNKPLTVTAFREIVKKHFPHLIKD